MYKRVGIKKLGKKTAHRKSMIQNQMRTLFNFGVLRTTTAKAKVVKSRSESLISEMKQKEISLETRRKFIRILGSRELVEKALKYSKGESVGVRIRKIGYRSGDNSEVSKLELIGFETKKKTVKSPDEKKDTKKKNKTKTKVVNKDIESKGKKTVGSKKVVTQKKSTERARTRSGL